MTKWHAAIVACSGATVLTLGYGAGLECVKTVIPGHVPMMPLTAVCFMIVAVMLCAVSEQNHKGRAWTSGSAAALLSTLALYNHIWGLGADERAWAGTVAKGLPSLLSILSFALLGVAGIAREFRLAIPVALIAATALAGHAVGNLHMQGYIDGGSGAMAIHTAALFLVAADALRRAHASQRIGDTT